MEYPIKSYCTNLDVGSSVGEALQLAEDNGFVVLRYEPTLKQRTIVINNHMAPLFRLGCFVEVSSGKIIGTNIYGID